MLEVRSLALIDNLTFYPSVGLNVITGETGAGKSMLLDAVSLLLGERASADVIRTGEESALMQAIFSDVTVERTQAKANGDELLFSREVRRSGPNICRINGRVEPLTQMAAWGRQLVDLHGQNKQQSLLAASTQRELLDAYGGKKLAQCCKEVAILYKQLSALQEELQALGGDDAAVVRQVDFLRFQLDEIMMADISAAEEEELEKRLRRLTNAQQLMERTHRAYEDLYEADNDSAIIDRLGVVEKELAAASSLDDTLTEILQQVVSAAEQIMDAARELRSYQDTVSLDQEDLQEVTVRLETYRKIKQKYGPTLLDVEQLTEQLQRELDELTHRSAKRVALTANIEQTTASLHKAAASLSHLRLQTATILAERINQALQSLALQGAQFSIHVQQEKHCGVNGYDKIEFQLAANVGEPLRSLAKTASGGEISRVMLAIKSVLAEQDAVDTLIFDEIDAGIGGLTVRAVAEKLKQLAIHRQVICVTHQPLIAAAADHHFLIFKESHAGRAVTHIKKLSLEEREAELTRMLGGEDEVALAHAKKLLHESQAS
ncbi:MAG: DNA repair protein RecN [Firmicutes bacterium]|nr:DNA repair protein RecN [Bacillota bacterium]